MNNKLLDLANANMLPEIIPCSKHSGAYTEIHGDNGDTILLMHCIGGMDSTEGKYTDAHYFTFDILK